MRSDVLAVTGQIVTHDSRDSSGGPADSSSGFVRLPPQERHGCEANAVRDQAHARADARGGQHRAHVQPHVQGRSAVLWCMGRCRLRSGDSGLDLPSRCVLTHTMPRRVRRIFPRLLADCHSSFLPRVFVPPPVNSTDQICVPSSIDEVIRLYTKAVLREQPDEANLFAWSQAWFKERAAERAAGAHEAAIRCWNRPAHTSLL